MSGVPVGDICALTAHRPIARAVATVADNTRWDPATVSSTRRRALDVRTAPLRAHERPDVRSRTRRTAHANATANANVTIQDSPVRAALFLFVRPNATPIATPTAAPIAVTPVRLSPRHTPSVSTVTNNAAADAIDDVVLILGRGTRKV